MSKYTFVKQPEDDNWLEEGDSTLTTEFNAVSLDRLLEEFELFLKGSGFVFDGHLEFVEHKSWTETEEDDLDNIEQFFGKARETAKKLDEVAIMKADVSPKTDEEGTIFPGLGYGVPAKVKELDTSKSPTPPWPFTNGYID